MDINELTNDATGVGILDLEVGKVLRNTYLLLGATITFSALMALVSMALNVPYMGLWMLLPYIGLLFMIERTKNSASGNPRISLAINAHLAFRVPAVPSNNHSNDLYFLTCCPSPH